MLIKILALIAIFLYLSFGVAILRFDRIGDVIAMLDGDGFPKTALAMMIGFIMLWPLYLIVMPCLYVVALFHKKYKRTKHKS